MFVNNIDANCNSFQEDMKQIKQTWYLEWWTNQLSYPNQLNQSVSYRVTACDKIKNLGNYCSFLRDDEKL